MRLKPVKFPLPGNHTITRVEILQILLEQGTELVADYGNLMGFGQEFRKCEEWIDEVRALANPDTH